MKIYTGDTYKTAFFLTQGCRLENCGWNAETSQAVFVLSLPAGHREGELQSVFDQMTGNNVNIQSYLQAFRILKRKLQEVEPT